MEVKKLKGLLLAFDRYYRKERSKLKKPVRAKHFLEDLNIIINLIEDNEKTKRFGYWSHKSIKDLFALERQGEQ